MLLLINCTWFSELVCSSFVFGASPETFQKDFYLTGQTIVDSQFYNTEYKMLS